MIQMILYAVLIILLIVASVYPRPHALERYANGTPASIPKIIWSYWHDLDTLPETVRLCIQSWKDTNPQYDIRLLSAKTAPTVFPRLSTLKHNDSHARATDFLRLHVLAEHGGIWMDASTLCTQSLEWVHRHQQQGEYDVIAFYMDGFTTLPHAPVIESWFIACVPHSPFVRLWKDEFFRMEQFPTVRAYVQDVQQRQGVDLQKLNWLEYLTIHVAAQVVIQKHDEVARRVKVLKAEEGPFKYLAAFQWNAHHALQALCDAPQEYKTPLVKLRSSERLHLEKHKNMIACLDLSHKSQPHKLAALARGVAIQ